MKRKFRYSIFLLISMMFISCNTNTKVEETLDNIWAPYEETIKLTTVTDEYPSAVYPEDDDVTNNVWIRA